MSVARFLSTGRLRSFLSPVPEVEEHDTEEDEPEEHDTELDIPAEKYDDQDTEVYIRPPIHTPIHTPNTTPNTDDDIDLCPPPCNEKKNSHSQLCKNCTHLLIHPRQLTNIK